VSDGSEAFAKMIREARFGPDVPEAEPAPEDVPPKPPPSADGGLGGGTGESHRRIGPSGHDVLNEQLRDAARQSRYGGRQTGNHHPSLTPRNR
jgi:hypothetical protein